MEDEVLAAETLGLLRPLFFFVLAAVLLLDDFLDAPADDRAVFFDDAAEAAEDGPLPLLEDEEDFLLLLLLLLMLLLTVDCLVNPLIAEDATDADALLDFEPALLPLLLLFLLDILVVNVTGGVAIGSFDEAVADFPVARRNILSASLP
jgi:hypothetical protein